MQKINNKIQELEELTGEQNRYWICGENVGEILRQKVVEMQAKNVLEIGTSIGYSALWICKGLVETKGRLFTIESHKERGDLAAKHFEEAEVADVVTLVRGHAPEILEEAVFDGAEFDLVFFDATKYEHVSYFEEVFPRMREGAVLVVDNVISHGEGSMMRKFLELIKSHPEIQSEIFDVGSGILVAKKLVK